MELRARLLAWMNGGQEDFETISLEIFHHQFFQNLPYQNYCKSLGKNPENVSSWLEIPALPTDVYKLPKIALTSYPHGESSGYFQTSGTTSESRGIHHYRALDLYQASITGTWRELELPPIRNPWFFSQTPSVLPHSSLVKMFSILDQGGHWLIDEEGALMLAGFQPTEPASVFGTSIALLKACDEMPQCTLPAGSWIFETGGSKGLRKSFTPEEVRSRLSDHLGVPHDRILNEYSMTELFSQFYKWGHQSTHRGASWTAVRVMNVFTGKLAALGEIGYLEIIDLANLDSLIAIRTQDLAIATGPREFTLIGRDPKAIPRGCSRGVDDAMRGR